MLTAEGCAARRRRLVERLKPSQPLVLADPLHLRYFANFYVDGPNRSLQPMLPGTGWNPAVGTWDYAIAANGAVALRAASGLLPASSTAPTPPCSPTAGPALSATRERSGVAASPILRSAIVTTPRSAPRGPSIRRTRRRRFFMARGKPTPLRHCCATPSPGASAARARSAYIAAPTPRA